MKSRVPISTTIRVAVAAIFTSLVFVATVVFSIYVPQTRGFFNIGETMVYITALLFGPLVGAFAGGFGSMFADLFLGYSIYAPATLVTKACEGAVVGVLARRRLKFSSKLQWKLFTVAFGLVLGVLLGIVGSTYYSGSVEVYFGLPPPPSPTMSLSVPKEFWYSLGGLVVLLVSLMGFLFEPELGWVIFSILIGGSVMIAGYFLYEQFYLGVLAIAEVPINIGQMTVGLIVSVPTVKAIRRSLPSLKSL